MPMLTLTPISGLLEAVEVKHDSVDPIDEVSSKLLAEDESGSELPRPGADLSLPPDEAIMSSDSLLAYLIFSFSNAMSNDQALFYLVMFGRSV